MGAPPTGGFEWWVALYHALAILLILTFVGMNGLAILLYRRQRRNKQSTGGRPRGRGPL